MKILLKKQDAFDYFGDKYPTQKIAQLCGVTSQAVSMWKDEYVPDRAAMKLYILSKTPGYRRRGKLPVTIGKD